MFFKTDEAFIVDNYIYIKMTIRFISNGQDFTVCQNIGINCFFIVRSFLSYFKDMKIIQVEAPAKISGYLGFIIKLKEQAIWIYFVLNIFDNGISSIVKMQVRVQVIEELAVNLFFSNVELYEYKMYMDFDSCIIIFLIIDNFRAPFQIQYIDN